MQRLETVDALRAFALFGLYIVHMVLQFELYWLDPQGGRVLHWVSGIFLGKAFALFALCFGLSFFIIMDRARQRGVDFRWRFAWRLTLLFGFGLLHTAIYRGDVLTVLAPLGLLLLLFDRIRSNATLVALATACLLQPQLVGLAVAGSERPLAFTQDPFLPTLATTGSLLEAARLNLIGAVTVKAWYTLETGRLTQILGLFLVGLVLGRSGFFAEPARFARVRRVAIVGALALYVLLGQARTSVLDLFGPPEAAAYMALAWDSWRNLALMAVEMLAFLELCAWSPWVVRLLAPVGRMTLSLYVLQSAIFVPFYYGFGLNMHAKLSQSASLTIGVASFALQILAAHLWFRRFQFGPLEWLWRSLTFLSREVPFLRRAPRAAAAA